MTWAPAPGRRSRASLCAGSACLALALGGTTGASAQSLTRDLLNPQRGGFVATQDLPLRPTPGTSSASSSRVRNVFTQPDSDEANPPLRPTSTAALQPPPSSANADNAGVAYDALNRKRQQMTS